MQDINKTFQLRCKKCCYSEFSSGFTKDLVHLHEIKVCANCHGKRQFRCPKCGGTMLMKRNIGSSNTQSQKPTGQ